MMILKELWTNKIPDDETKSSYKYILDLKERLEETCEIANQQLKKASGKAIHQENKSSDERGEKGSCSSSYLIEQTFDAMERSVYNCAENWADG